MNEKANKRGSYYWRNEKPYLSVTTILGIIDKSNALIPWACGETYDSIMMNPSISREEALSAHRRASESAKNRGSAVHDLIEAWKNIGEVKGQEGMYGGYAKAFQTFINDHPLEIIDQEKTVTSKLGYAGTLDFLCKLNGKVCLIDMKTNKDGRLYPEIQLQLSAYTNALQEEGIKVEEMYGLALAEDGTYTFKPFNYELEPFLACKRVYEWKNKSSLEKVGYAS